jgi:hypothetical protein
MTKSSRQQARFACMQRLATGLALTLAAALVPTTAIAAPSVLPPVKRTLTASKGSCATTTYRTPMSGFVTVRDDGTTKGDWDLAVTDARSRSKLASSKGFRANEVAQTFVGAAQKLTVRGCHVSGGDTTFPVQVVFSDAQPPKATRPSLVRLPTMDEKVLNRLDSLGFDVTHNVRDGHADVIAPTAAKLALLEKLGLNFKLRSLDLRKDFVKAREADLRYATRMGAKGSPLPSGRTGYRTLADHQAELKAMVKDHPGLTRPVTLGQTYQGRDIAGVEISKNVDAANDGRPTFLMVGNHHAREWPSGEIAIEFAHYLIDGYGSDPQITSLLERERVVVVPIINVDGYNASRGAADDGYFPDPADSTGLGDLQTVEGVAPPFGGNLAYRRKNCNGAVPNGPNHEEQDLPCYYQIGVDPNRNYGQNWGGVGAGTDQGTQSYRGAGQWSEPETQAVWHWSQAHNVTFMMTLHNVAALVLRPPGVHTDGQAPDEARMKELGDQMAADTGYTSQYGFELYDTSGTTEDWQYGGQGAFGYTIEIGPAGGDFHMPYQVGVVDQWTGTGERAGKGLRSALLRAAESAGNTGDHSVIKGAAPAGSVLRLKKSFNTFSSPVCTYAQGYVNAGTLPSDADCLMPGDPVSTPDHLDYTMVVPSSNTYEWHVTPSTRPFVARKITPGGYDATAYQTDKYDAVAGEAPAADRGIDDPQGINEQPEDPYSVDRKFSVAPGEAGNKVLVDLTWGIPLQDYDLKVYRRQADGSLTPAGTGTGPTGGSAGSSGEANGIDEQVEIARADPGEYVARVIYYLTGAQQSPDANDWHMEVSRYKVQPDKVENGREYWTMSCEKPDGTVLESKEIYVERGQAVTADFACGAAAPPQTAGDGGGAAGDGGAGTGTAPASDTGTAPASDTGTTPAGGVLGDRQSGGAKKPAAKKPTKRATCLKKASKIKSKSKRSAAVRTCKKRYPTMAERRAAARKRR